MIVRNKKQMLDKLVAGDFGNKLRQWDTIDDIVKSGYRGTVSIRVRKVSHGSARYNVPIDSLVENREEYYNESAPDEKLTIQGEIIKNEVGVRLFYSTSKMKMRLALREAKQLDGLAAIMLLKRHMNPSSYADLEALQDLYPDSAIEFSCYEMNLGDIPGRNSIIWEIRNY